VISVAWQVPQRRGNPPLGRCAVTVEQSWSGLTRV
jgi:hypothetical protein